MPPATRRAHQLLTSEEENLTSEQPPSYKIMWKSSRHLAQTSQRLKRPLLTTNSNLQQIAIVKQSLRTLHKIHKTESYFDSTIRKSLEWSTAAQKLANAPSSIVDSAKNSLDNLTTNAKGASVFASESAAKVAKGLAESVHASHAILHSSAETAASVAKKAAHTIVDLSKQTVETASEVGKKSLHFASDSASKATKGLSQVARQASSTMIDLSKQTAETALEVGQKTVELGKKTVDVVSESTSQLASTISSSVKQAGESVSDSSIKAATFISETVSDAASKAGTVLSDTAQATAKTVASTTTGAASQAGKLVSSAATTIVSGTTNAASNLVTGTSTRVRQAWQARINKLKNHTTNLLKWGMRMALLAYGGWLLGSRLPAYLDQGIMTKMHRERVELLEREAEAKARLRGVDK